jgi:hypothetical protein
MELFFCQKQNMLAKYLFFVLLLHSSTSTTVSNNSYQEETIVKQSLSAVGEQDEPLIHEYAEDIINSRTPISSKCNISS